jgi:hypothetical protein
MVCPNQNVALFALSYLTHKMAVATPKKARILDGWMFARSGGFPQMCKMELIYH